MEKTYCENSVRSSCETLGIKQKLEDELENYKLPSTREDELAGADAYD